MKKKNMMLRIRRITKKKVRTALQAATRSTISMPASASAMDAHEIAALSAPNMGFKLTIKEI